MSWIDAVVLGIIQGLTEFIPVSSDGHLSAAEMLMPRFGQVGLLFDVMVHVGTLAAILIYYRKLLREEISGLVSTDAEQRRTAWRLAMLLLVATVPTGITGLWMKHYVEQTKTNARFVGAMEILTGLYLAVSYFRREGDKTRKTMTYLDAFVIGTVQGFAVLPGLSRSASTIGFGLLLGFTGRWAADYTFLLAIPAIVGAAGVEILSALRHEGAGFFATPDFAKYLVGAAVAGVIGYSTIAFLIRMVSTRKVHYFAIYCFVFGLILIFFFPGFSGK
ncbi:MAG TPA: undecaprenyl-diphosphate phosphatase [Thermoanaerobaculia bacterium]